MAMDTFIVFAASYDTLGAAEADHHAVREAAERAAAQYSSFRPPPGGDDVVTRLGDLARLREAGVLSSEEFEVAKAKLLSG